MSDVLLDKRGARTAPSVPADLSGWAEDDHEAAARAWVQSPDATTVPGAARDAFERMTLRPLGGVHVTGYYEPELDGAASRSPEFPVPIHAPPAMGIGASRMEIEAGNLLAGQEIAWLRDEVDRFFLQVQGSGRVRLTDGTVLRVAYAGRNGHPYRSLGQLLVERGELAAERVTADAVADWLRADVDRGRALMRENPSYVMFRPLRGTRAEDGPPGTLGRALTPMRSVAVDPKFVPLGSLVWLEVGGPEPIRRLCVAQDTGSAIVGPRVDLFVGTGAVAGRVAGAMNARGLLTVLAPA